MSETGSSVSRHHTPFLIVLLLDASLTLQRCLLYHPARSAHTPDRVTRFMQHVHKHKRSPAAAEMVFTKRANVYSLFFFFRRLPVSNTVMSRKNLQNQLSASNRIAFRPRSCQCRTAPTRSFCARRAIKWVVILVSGVAQVNLTSRGCSDAQYTFVPLVITMHDCAY